MAHPNVLLVCVDHWPAHLLGCAGHPHILTPTLDTLADNGVRYTNAYAEVPICVPSRRCLMLGVSPRQHGVLTNSAKSLPADMPTLPECFKQDGYQTYAVGKLHVHPQRARIGFDDVLLEEEGRAPASGTLDDYEIYLGDKGHPGERFAHGMNNNLYVARPWHLPEPLHVTNWATEQVCRVIKRRDPGRPAFWYLSYSHPHPPLEPLQHYFDLYYDMNLPEPPVGKWVKELDTLPAGLHGRIDQKAPGGRTAERAAIAAFYALCTHIDHQLRRVIGTLRQEGLLDNTIIAFMSDHGDMLGQHHIWAKSLFYEPSANVPLIISGLPGDARAGKPREDDRLVAVRDVMPTLLQLANLPIPTSCEGLSAVGDVKREHLYGEIFDCQNTSATRMIHDGRHKLIYYGIGDRMQLFDLKEDPHELRDLSTSPDHESLRQRLTDRLIDELYGEAREAWLTNGHLTGLPDRKVRKATTDRGLSGQRGDQWPPPSR